jgi:hypothetical protein
MKENLKAFLEHVEVVCLRKGMFGITTTRELVCYISGWMVGRFPKEELSTMQGYKGTFQDFINKKTGFYKTNLHWGASLEITFDEETIFEEFPKLVAEFVEKQGE